MRFSVNYWNVYYCEYVVIPHVRNSMSAGRTSHSTFVWNLEDESDGHINAYRCIPHQWRKQDTSHAVA